MAFPEMNGDAASPCSDSFLISALSNFCGHEKPPPFTAQAYKLFFLHWGVNVYLVVMPLHIFQPSHAPMIVINVPVNNGNSSSFITPEISAAIPAANKIASNGIKIMDKALLFILFLLLFIC
jgi:hypothetical protein